MSGTNLDVALTLRLKNLLSKDAKVAARDLAGVKTAAEKLNMSGKGSAKFGQEMAKAGVAAGKLGQGLYKVKINADDAARAMSKMKAGTSEIDALKRRIDALSKSYDRLKSSKQRAAQVRDVSSRADIGVGKKEKGGKGDFKREALYQMGGNAYLLGAGRMGMAGAAAGAAVGIPVAAQVAATRQAIAYEKAFADVKKKVNLDPGETWGDLEATMNKVSRAIGISRENTAALTAQAGQAGIQYKDLAEFIMLAAKTSSAWDIQPKEASERLAKVKAQTQWNNKELEEFADKVNALGDQSASAEKDIAEMFQRAAGSAKAAGVDFDTSLGITTALNSIGMAEETASRFFNAFSSKLRTASDQPDKAAEGYKKLGLTVKQVEAGMKTDAAKTILDILDRLEKHPDKASVATKLFGQEWWDEAARAGQALPEIRKNLEMLKSGSWKGSLQKNLEIDLATTQNKLERTKVLVSEIGDRMGRWTLPPLNAALQAIIDKYDALAERFKKDDDARKIGDKVASGEDLTPKEVEQLGKDPELSGKVDVAANNSDKKNKINQTIADIETLRTKIEALEASGRTTAGRDGVNAYQAALDKLEAKKKELAAIEASIVEAKKREQEVEQAPKVNLPAPPVRPRADLKEVDALIAKLEQLNNLSKESQRANLSAGSKEAIRTQISGLVTELATALQNPKVGSAGEGIMDKVAQGMASASGKAKAEAEKLMAQIKTIMAAPIVVNIQPKLNGSVGATPASGGNTPAKAKGKGAALGKGSFSVGTLHVHGVKDTASLHRQVAAAADRTARGNKSGALHDVDYGDVG